MPEQTDNPKFKPFEMMWHIRDCQKFNKVELALMYALLARTRDSRFSCYPSWAKLEEDTDYKKRALQVAAASLEKGGWIKIYEKTGQTNTFIIKTTAIRKAADVERAEMKRLRAAARSVPDDEEEMPGADDPELETETSNPSGLKLVPAEELAAHRDHLSWALEAAESRSAAWSNGEHRAVEEYLTKLGEFCSRNEMQVRSAFAARLAELNPNTPLPEIVTYAATTEITILAEDEDEPF